MFNTISVFKMVLTLIILISSLFPISDPYVYRIFHPLKFEPVFLKHIKENDYQYKKIICKRYNDLKITGNNLESLKHENTGNFILKSRSVYQLDSLQNIIEYKLYPNNYKKSMMISNKYEYDERNNCILDIYYDHDRGDIDIDNYYSKSITWMNQYQYDTNNNLLKTYQYEDSSWDNNEGWYKQEYYNTYDLRGNIIKVDKFDVENNEHYLVDFKYDLNDNLVEEIKYDYPFSSNRGKSIRKDVYKYNSNDDISEIIVYVDDELYSREIFLYLNNNPWRIDRYNKDNILSRIVEFEYNSDNVIIKQSTYKHIDNQKILSSFETYEYFK